MGMVAGEEVPVAVARAGVMVAVVRAVVRAAGRVEVARVVGVEVAREVEALVADRAAMVAVQVEWMVAMALWSLQTERMTWMPRPQ